MDGHVVGRTRECDREMEATQQRQAAHVADEDEAAIVDERQRAVQDPAQIVDAREVLNDRVEHHGIEALGRRRIVGVAVQELDPARQGASVQLLFEPGQRRVGEVHAHVAPTSGRETKQQHAGAAPNLEHALRIAPPDARRRLFGLLAHLVERERRPRVAAPPSGDVERRVLDGAGDAVVDDLIVDLAPAANSVAAAAARRRRRMVGARDDVGRQVLVAGGVGHHDGGGLADGGMEPQHRFDLVELDAKTAQLHLAIGTPHEQQLAVAAAARAIARAVHARAGRCRERIGHEGARRLGGAVQVAARDALAADIDLAELAVADGRSRLVEEIDDAATDRRTERKGIGDEERIVAAVRRGEGRALRRPVSSGGSSAMDAPRAPPAHALARRGRRRSEAGARHAATRRRCRPSAGTARW